MSVWPRAALAAALLFATSQTALAQPAESQRARAGIVRITSAIPGGQPQVGTGFVLALTDSTAHIITAAHVVEGNNRPGIEFFGHRGRVVEATVLRIEGGNSRGLALLSVEGTEALFAGVSALSTETAVPLVNGDEVFAVGMNRATRPWAVMRGSVVNQDGRIIVFSPALPAGFSGGPLLRDGRVVGIVVETESNVSNVVSSQSIVIFAGSVLTCPPWNDQELIDDVLVRFTRAIRSLDYDELQDVWPDVSTAWRGTLAQVRSWAVDLFSCDTRFLGDDRATVRCETTDLATFRDSPEQSLFPAISEFPKWRKYLISLCFRGKSSVRPVQVGGFDVNIVTHRRGGPVRYHAWPPPWEPSCRTRTGPLWKLIGIGGHLAVPPLPHHRAYGSVPRRFGRLSGQDRSRYGNPSESK